MMKYFRLRLPQWLLIISVALPVALAFSVQVSATGFIDTGTFGTVATGCIAVMWGGLALYTRDIDRQRHLPDVLMTYVHTGDTTVSMKRNEKADIVWLVLQDDALYRKQLRLWGRGLVLMMAKGGSWMPAILLSSICLVLWLNPEDLVRQVRGWLDADLACAVYTAANFLFSLFVSIGALAGILRVMEKKEGEIICFRAAYQEGVCQWVSGQQKTEDETPASNEGVLNDEEPK